LRTLQISSTDYMGGASRSAWRLHEGLRRLGCESRMFVETKLRSDADVKRYQPSTAPFERLARTVRGVRLERALKKYSRSLPFERTLFADDRTRWGADPVGQIPKSDLIQLHWVGGFLDYGAFFRWLPKTMPLVFTLHDMANFTGGCCFDLECGKFTKGCGACPQLGSRDANDLSRQVWRRKQKYFGGLAPERVRVVAPCAWMANEAKRSELLGRFGCSVIPYGLDLEVFRPRECRVARDVLGIPFDAAVVLFLADNINQYRKGPHVLARALEQLEATREVFLLSLGKDPIPELSRFRHAHFDDITNDRTLSFVYSAADLFVLPSLGDNLPNTGLEAIACGTPVVAFETGGVPEMVRPGVTGLLAPKGDAAKLKEAMVRLLGDPGLRAEMSANCRKIASAEYDLAIQARRYVEIYEELYPGQRATSALAAATA
jgi:glycosyltransferase involved in cell wall biosynthesis